MAVNTPLDVAVIKKDFPILERVVHGHRLVYLDSASSSQKPRSVIDAMDHLYETSYANTHRGVYVIGQESTALYEAVHQRAVEQRDPLHQERHRGHQPGRLLLGTGQPR